MLEDLTSLDQEELLSKVKCPYTFNFMVISGEEERMHLRYFPRGVNIFYQRDRDWRILKGLRTGSMIILNKNCRSAQKWLRNFILT